MCVQCSPAPDRLSPSAHIAEAADEAWTARRTSIDRRVARYRTRQRLAAIDDMLATLEARHLAGERTFDRLTRARLSRLEKVVGLPLPRKALRARNTVRLHAALLDWQEDLLDEIVPERQLYSDVYDQDWNAVEPAMLPGAG
jgi:hypothetical protein